MTTSADSASEPKRTRTTGVGHDHRQRQIIFRGMNCAAASFREASIQAFTGPAAIKNPFPASSATIAARSSRRALRKITTTRRGPSR